jgi:[acyl-carrier-protein] S-malonyltransferase
MNSLANAIAIVFPGQGSQSVGMLNGYAGLATVDVTLAIAHQTLGFDIAAMMRDGPDELLAKTVNTQPVMLTAGVVAWRAWQALGGPQPQLVAGHSLGEYTALVAAGALSFEDALRIVRLRAEAMQRCVPEGVGGIAVILGSDLVTVREVCAASSTATEVVEAANLNDPKQIVVAGHRPAVERAIVLAKEKGAKRGMMLPMSVPSHCSLMKPAAAELAAALASVNITAPKFAVIQNASVQASSDPAVIKARLAEQLYSPVRWIETVEYFAAQGVTRAFELGAGKALTGMIGRITPAITAQAVTDKATLEAALAAM